MHVRGFAVSVRVLAMVEGRSGVLLCLVVVAVIVVMGRLPVVVGGCLMMRSSIVVMVAGQVLLFLCHGNSSFKTTIRDGSGQSARLASITNLRTVAVVTVARHRQKKPAWRNTLRYSATSAYSSTSPPAPAGLLFI
jgi:hypothetical protein